jgi:leader peptidase (prepilin peptidase)/N-methyltransferase
LTGEGLQSAWLIAAALTPLAVGFGPYRLFRSFDARWRPADSWALTGAAAVAGGAAAGLSAPLMPPVASSAVFGLAAAVLAALAVIDFRYLKIPNLYSAILLAVALLRPDALSWPLLLAGMAVGGGLPLAVAALYARVRAVEGLGFGDVKLLAAAGALLGPTLVLWVIFAGSVIGIGLALVRRRSGGAPAIPFGTALAAPTLLFLGVAMATPG